MQHFLRNILAYTVIPLLIFTMAASYYRFVVLDDYLVSYKMDCDPTVASCYLGCQDLIIADISDCPTADVFYYTKVERYAADLIKLCGENITACPFANTCTNQERSCSISFCDPQKIGSICDPVDHRSSDTASLPPQSPKTTTNSEL